MKIVSLLIVFGLIGLCSLIYIKLQAQTAQPVWSKEKINEWYKSWGWLRGCNFIPSTAINQLAMWQSESFDAATIDRELGYAESIGLNCMRVFLHHLAWELDPIGFKDRMNTYLTIADKHHIVTLFVFFNDCENEIYKAGKQSAPEPGIHNLGQAGDPGKLLYDDPRLVNDLENYVKDVLTTFKHDKRILLWDLYNEPGNSGYGSKRLALLEKIFHWARQINPDQPLSAGVWSETLQELNAFQLTQSDVITYHNYEDEKKHQQSINGLKKYGRPLICTEYMTRLSNSRFENIMPILKAQGIGAINRGLVAGKTNTAHAWDTPVPDGSEAKIGLHDIFRPNGVPFDEHEIAFIRSMAGK